MLDKLKIIPSDRIITFESPAEARSTQLAEEIEREGRLRNPLLVQPIDDHYLLLDEVSIFSALEQLGVVHILAQVADTENLTVRPWQRMVENLSMDDVVGFVERFPRQAKIIENPSVSLAAIEAEIHFSDGKTCRVSFESKSPLVRADLCIKFCRCCIQGKHNFKAKISIDDPKALEDYPEASAVIFPPMFSLGELAIIAGHGIRLPHDLVRMDQPGRILGVDYGLSILKETASISEKESFLMQLIRMRVLSNRSAYYGGAVFMLNN